MWPGGSSGSSGATSSIGGEAWELVEFVSGLFYINYVMKKYLLLLVFFSVCTVCRAQYYYNPVVVTGDDETTKLNNIRFDVDAIGSNDAAYARYVEYSDKERSYARRRTFWSAVGWTGFGVSCASLIPMFKELDLPSGDPRSEQLLDRSLGLALGGLGAICVGCVGWSSVNGKMKSNKKDMIFYLKTTNNGVGIVTIL